MVDVAESEGPRLPVAPGDVIDGRYLVGPVIGEGGMGIVCAATHLGLAAPVALKLIRSDLKNDPEFVLRFMNEARAAAVLKGEHIATVHDVGQLRSGEPYLVMERLDGVELDTVIERRAPLDEMEAVSLVLQVCEGLEEAHAVGLIHRDIKPANLILSRRADGHSVLKILDFGISKNLLGGHGRALTNPDRSLGSPWYMSPEQMTNASGVDQRTDIWSVGVVLFELLTRSLPFDGPNVPEVCAKVLDAPVPSLGAVRRGIDPRIEAIVTRCLEKNPNLRYPSVRALADDLRAVGSAAKPAPSAERADTEPVLSSERARRRGRSTLGSLATVAVRSSAGRRPFPGFVVIALGVGASLGYLGWTHPELVDESLQRAAHSRVTLPGDPVLGPDVVESLVGHEWSATQMLLSVDSTSLVAPSTAGAEERAEPSLTPQEIRRRTRNYERWLIAHGMRRLGDVEGLDGGVAPVVSSKSESAVPAEVTE